MDTFEEYRISACPLDGMPVGPYRRNAAINPHRQRYPHCSRCLLFLWLESNPLRHGAGITADRRNHAARYMTAEYVRARIAADPYTSTEVDYIT